MFLLKIMHVPCSCSCTEIMFLLKTKYACSMFLQLKSESLFRQSALSMYGLLELGAEKKQGEAAVLPFPAKNRLLR